ncbi:DUF2218 domain-containing protein [Litoreibacter janthinus]|uniref:2,4-dihydroxyhept-2-ene-1,7-dioic acid aldolase n=1 Tax=Litoreibacter janthinus TaxID=670154 RepID=A0A1I6H4Z4_9RHOB|nr:DUF2218 domain-containing protein [Litoreibacter janthinus]SFR49586.1 hypothetical protein SAMN04488002_2536 [Litoreibacter janthinus]
MFTNTVRITTTRASTYLQQLCKHFGHKVEVQFDPHSGHIKFPFGQCDLSTEQDSLVLTVTAENQADQTKIRSVIASHLERFAFRENPKIEWQPKTAA